MNKKGYLNLIIIAIVLIAGLWIVGHFIKDRFSLSVYDSGEASFTYTHKYDSEPLLIGDNEFTATSLSYICGDTGDSSVSYPEPRHDCWRTQIKYEGKVYTISGEHSAQLSPYLSVTLHPRGKIYFEDGEAHFKRDSSWTSTYQFHVRAPDILISEFNESEEYIELDSNAKFKLSIDNNLASFDDKHAGIYQKHSHKLFEIGNEWDQKPFPIKEGENEYFISPDSSKLGKVTTEVQPFIVIDADKTVIIRQNNPISVEYEVVLDLDKYAEAGTESEIEILDDEDVGFFKGVWNWFKGWFD